MKYHLDLEKCIKPVLNLDKDDIKNEHRGNQGCDTHFQKVHFLTLGPPLPSLKFHNIC